MQSQDVTREMTIISVLHQLDVLYYFLVLHPAIVPDTHY